MPNTDPPIDTPAPVATYKAECEFALGSGCRPLMTIYLRQLMTPETIKACKDAGATAIKVYPAGMTTNSHAGLSRDDFTSIPTWFGNALATAQSLDMPVLFHGELPGSFIMDAEKTFLLPFRTIARTFPKLRMVFEHVTDALTVETVMGLAGEGFRVAGTITMHHLWMENGLDDVLRPKMRPARFCMPIAKRPADHRALLRAVREDLFFLGTDSAWHPVHNKVNNECCAGCLTTPHPEMLIDTFEKHNLMEYLIDFTSVRMGAFYGLPDHEVMLKFKRSPWTVASECVGGDPFLAGQTVNWQLLNT